MAAPYSSPAVVATAMTTAAAPTAAPARPLAVDPWDAPYFGARTYFSYQPELVGLKAQTPGQADAETQPMTAAAATSPDASAPVVRVEATPSTRRRGWLARLLGRG